MTPASSARTGIHVSALRVLARGRVLAQAPDGTQLLIEVATRRTLWRGVASAVAVNATGDELAAVVRESGAGAEQVLRIDAITGAERGRAAFHPSIGHLVYSDRGRLAWESYAPSYDYGEVGLWAPGSEARETVSETGHLGPLAFIGEEQILVAEHGSLWVVEGDRIARSFPSGFFAEEVHPMGAGWAVVHDRIGRVRAFDVATGERRWAWDAPTAGGLTVRVDARTWRIARFPRYPEAASPSHLEWLTMREVPVRSAGSPPGEGPWRDAWWVPGWERLILCTSRAVHQLDARTGALSPVWAASGPDVVALAVGADGAAAWATADGEVTLTAPAPHLRKTVADEVATVAFVDGDRVTPLYSGPDWIDEMSQVCDEHRVEAELRSGHELVVLVRQRHRVRAGSQSTDTRVRRAFASADEGRTWRDVGLPEEGIAALEAALPRFHGLV